jgi:hypothetical protein
MIYTAYLPLPYLFSSDEGNKKSTRNLCRNALGRLETERRITLLRI